MSCSRQRLSPLSLVIVLLLLSDRLERAHNPIRKLWLPQSVVPASQPFRSGPVFLLDLWSTRCSVDGLPPRRSFHSVYQFRCSCV